MLLACSLMSACQSQTRREVAGRLSLPLVQFEDGILLEARTASGEELILLLDSGASVSVISSDVVSRLGLNVRQDERLIIAADGTSSRATHAATLGDLELGGLVVREVEAMVLDVSHLGRDVDGILAMNALGTRVTIDYEHAEVTVGGDVPAGAVRLGFVSGTMARVEAVVAGRAIEVILDTAGNGAWSLPLDGFSLLPGPSVQRGVLQIDGARVRSSERLDGSARIGSVEFQEPIVHASGGPARVGQRVLCELGVLTFDLADRCVWIHDAAYRSVNMDPMRGIGAILHPQAESWVVRSVEPGLPAWQVGLAPGEQVFAIDGMTRGALTAGALRARVARSGVLGLDVVRDGQRVTLPVPVVYIQP